MGHVVRHRQIPAVRGEATVEVALIVWRILLLQMVVPGALMRQTLTAVLIKVLDVQVPLLKLGAAVSLWAKMEREVVREHIKKVLGVRRVLEDVARRERLSILQELNVGMVMAVKLPVNMFCREKSQATTYVNLICPGRFC